MRTPITYYGGKQTILPHILPLIPTHEIYTEAFFGGGAVFFSKHPVKAEIVNDLNSELINFYRVLKTQVDELAQLVDETIHSRQLHKDAWVIYNHPHLFDSAKRAWAVWVLSKQGFSGQLSNSFGYDASGSTVRKVNNAKKVLMQDYQKRLEHVTIESRDGLQVIKAYDRPTTFHYVDTPYFNSDCGHYDGYTQSMFEACLQTLENVQGKFMLSNYPSEVLEHYSQKNGWFVRDFEFKVAVTSKTDKVKVERLVANYDITGATASQKTLFS